MFINLGKWNGESFNGNLQNVIGDVIINTDHIIGIHEMNWGLNTKNNRETIGLAIKLIDGSIVEVELNESGKLDFYSILCNLSKLTSRHKDSSLNVNPLLFSSNDYRMEKNVDELLNSLDAIKHTIAKIANK